MVFVNARRVSDLRTEVENIPQPEGYTYRDSSIVTGKDGVMGPKRYYWIKIKTVMKTTTGYQGIDSSKEETAEMSLETSVTDSDNDLLRSDVIRARIGFLYRPEDNLMIAVKPILTAQSNKLLLVKKKDSMVAFDNIPTGRYCTLIGLPPSVDGSQV
jgi:hypothetical protein